MMFEKVIPSLIFLIALAEGTGVAPQGDAITILGDRTNFFGADGKSFDSFVRRYFEGNFGKGGLEYLSEVSARIDGENIGGVILFKFGNDGQEQFRMNLKQEVSSIVNIFKSMDFTDWGAKVIGLTDSTTKSKVERGVRFRVHRLIGLFDYMRSHEWALPAATNLNSYDSMSNEEKQNLGILLKKFKLKNFLGNQDKIPPRFYKDSLKIVGMLSWPNCEATPKSVFDFLNNIFTAARAINYNPNQIIEDKRFKVCINL